MFRFHLFLLAVCMVVLAPAAQADVVIDYVVDAGGNNNNPLNGLSARGTFSVVGNTLTILLENTSTGVPIGFDDAASLLVSLGMILPTDYLSGDTAVIGQGSVGLSVWSGRGEGDSVAEEWLWTNDGGGDLLEDFDQVISTSNGMGGGHDLFGGGQGNVGGPYGGMARPDGNVNKNMYAVKNSILFTLTLKDTLSEPALEGALSNSMVEFGSDDRYLKPIPAPGAALLGLFGLALAGRVRRRMA